LGRPFLIPHSSFAGAFTLIEIMVVVAIMGIILAAGVPSLYGFMHKSGARKTMSDIVETCKSARQKAIMSGTIANLVIHPKDGTMEVEGGTSGGYGGWAQSAKIEGARLEALMINNNSQDDCLKYDQVKVRFFPNGTSDEMVLVLSTDNGQMEGVSLELTTGLPIILNDAGVKALVH
jgi:prepilin-type N-terminal cleavage/methylation domain-containing protein